MTATRCRRNGLAILQCTAAVLLGSAIGLWPVVITGLALWDRFCGDGVERQWITRSGE